MKYSGYNLYYFKGPGLNYRIRFGNPDRIYERDLCEVIVKYLQENPKPIFLDIGANIGLISLYVLSKVPAVKVFAFEPGPKQYAQFNATLFANHLENRLTLLPKAVSNAGGQVKFYTTQLVDGTSDGLRDTGRSHIPMKEISVQAITLDDWWQKESRPPVHVLKIDIEGQELKALDGARELVLNSRPVIFLEIVLLNLEGGLAGAQAVLQWFNSHGYKLCTLSGQLCQDGNLEERLKSCDNFMAKPG